MIKNLSAKDRRALIICAGSILAYLFIVLVAEPIYNKQKDMGRQIENKIFFIKKYYEILNQKAYYDQKAEFTRKTEVIMSQRFMGQKKPALAAADLQKTLEAYARQSNIQIENSRTEKPKYLEKLLAVPVEINIRSTLRNLIQFIQSIEKHQNFMVVEELATRRTNKTDPEELQTRLLVLGFIQELEPASPQKI